MPRPGWWPPNIVARWLSILVSVISAHGGGLTPLTVGEDQRPAGAYYINVCTFNQLDYDYLDSC